MTTIRLDSISPRLAALFQRADRKKRRRAALKACEVAAAESQLEPKEADLATTALRSAGRSDPDLRERVERRAVSLDDEYLRLWNDPNRSDEQRDEALILFSKARVFNALVFALSADDSQLHEAIYESVVAVGEPGRVIEAVEEELLIRT